VSSFAIEETVDVLRERLRGALLAPDDEGFEEATRLWNGMVGDPVVDLLGQQPYTQVQSYLDAAEPKGKHQRRQLRPPRRGQETYDPDNLLRSNRNIRPTRPPRPRPPHAPHPRTPDRS